MDNNYQFKVEKITDNEIKEILINMSKDIIQLKNEVKELRNEITILKDFIKLNVEKEKTEKIEKILEENKNKILSLNSSKEKIDKINQLVLEKGKIESSISKIKKNNDNIFEKIKFEVIKQKKLNDFKMNINDIFNLLDEQNQIGNNSFTLDFELEKCKLLSLDNTIIIIRDKLNYVNEKLKNKIEEKQDIIQLNLNKLNYNNKLIDVNNLIEFEKILNQTKNELNEYEKISNEYLSIGNEVEKFQNQIETSLKNINSQIGTLFQKIKNEKKNESQSSNQLIKKNEYINENNNDILNESIYIDEIIDPNQFFQSQLLKLNWNETATIQSDGIQIIEVNFILKAVACEKKCYKSYTYLFNINYNIEIIKVEMNSNEIKEPNYSSHRLKFNFTLYNNESLPIKIIYKQIPINFNEFYNKIFIGLSGMLYGRKANYTLNISEDLVICNIENNFFKDKGNGKYTWQGIVPYNGQMTSISVTPKKLKWKILKEINFYSDNGIKEVQISTPKFCLGGNNKILSYHIQNNSINRIDGKNLIQIGNKIKSKYNNINSLYGFLKFEINIENYSNYEWECGNEIQIPKDEEDNQIELSTFAIKIIEEDKSNAPNHIKIGKWVYKNINYKLSLRGKRITAIKILENKEGVCEHFTILYNALLNSIGIPAIYVSGYSIKKEDDKYIQVEHAWSIININGKWLGMDATWGLFNGILPISHIFFYYKGNEVHYFYNKNSNFLHEIHLNIEPDK